MRILHCCLAAFYIDNYGYQENILPRMHKLQGHEVRILASTETYVDNLHLGYVKPSEYINEDGISVHRIPYVKYLPLSIAKKLRYYKGVYKELELFKPDFIFLHDAQFMSTSDVVKYLKKHPEVKVVVDGHTDYINSAHGFISRRIMHGILYKHCIVKLAPYVSHFYGTLPLRVEFFKNVYGTPENKTDLLVMGADDTLVKIAKESNMRERIRSKYGISPETVLIVSGGKFTFGKWKILNVMDAVAGLSRTYDVKLMVFGSVEENTGFKEQFMSRCDGNTIIYVGWIQSKETYNYFEAADLIVFPGLHSVLWEQAVGQGKPCVFNKIEGQTHIDLGGNCLFVKDGTAKEFESVIEQGVKNIDRMKKVASEKGIPYFSYYEIAKRAVTD